MGDNKNKQVKGILYVVATPIGNLEDITLRAARILGEVDLIAAEDTRVSGKLLAHLGLKVPFTSYFEHNKYKKGEYIIGELLSGKNIAMISDAGMPGISDPGFELIAAAIAEEIEIIVIPGACAAVNALVGSGLDSSRFCFEGFLPRDKSRRRKRLLELAAEQRTMIFYESPHRVQATLAEMTEHFPDRRISAGRELTKRFEETVRGTVAEVHEYFSQKKPQGEFVLVLAGAEAAKNPQMSDEALVTALQVSLSKGLSRKAAAKEVAGEYGASVNYVYNLGL